MPGDKYPTSLFASEPMQLDLPDASITFIADFLPENQAEHYYQSLLEETDWRQESITVYGKTHATPRLSCWMGDAGTDYRYSNMTMQPVPWSAVVREIKSAVEVATAHSYNSVLVNYYRDGRDSNGWHSDDERELGRQPVIASLSLGAARDFQLRHKIHKQLKHNILLTPGSLVLMRGDTQKYWQHHIPKRANVDGRINLTFRTIKKTNT
jgi:alkylated DNA repair dioxygenase AlkB